MASHPPDPKNAGTAALASDLRVVLGALKRQLRAQANADEFTGSQIAVLGRLLRSGPATVTALAKAEGVRPQSLSTVVSGLEAAGMIKGAPDPSDGRQTILSLTAACEEWIKAGRAAREDWLSRAIQTKLSEGEQQQLAAGVALLKRLVDP